MSELAQTLALVGFISSGSGPACAAEDTGTAQKPEQGKVLDIQSKKGKIEFTPQVTIPGTRLQKGVPMAISDRTIGQYISDIYQFSVWAGGVLAVFLIIIWGYKILTAAGDKGKILKAKDSVAKALYGLIFIVFAYVILVNIDDRLVKFDGLNALTDVEYLEIYRLIDERKVTCGGAWTGGNIDQFDKDLKERSTAEKIDCTLLKSMMLMESSGLPEKVSPRGAKGLLQVVPKDHPEITHPKTGQKIWEVDFAKDTYFAIYAGAKAFRKFADNPCLGCNSPGKECAASTYPPGLPVVENNPNKYAYLIASYNGGSGANCESSDCEGKGQCDGIAKWECRINQGGYKGTECYVGNVIQTYRLLKNNGWGC